MRILFILMVIATTGCTNRSVYNWAQEKQKSECIEKVGIEKDRCIFADKPSYEEYQKLRNKVLNKEDTARDIP